MRIKLSIVSLFFSAVSTSAQDAPLSAIDWLAVQRDVAPVVFPNLPLQPEDPVAQSAAIPSVEVLPLDAPSIGGVGLLPSSMTGLPATLWQGSDENALIDAMTRLKRTKPSVPALNALFQTLLLAEAAPPNGSDGEELFKARVSLLFDFGLVAPAEALMERAGNLTPELFSQAFDLALLTGSDGALCQSLGEDASLSSDLPTRIWCTTRDGDFPLAVTIYQTGAALGQFSQLDDELLLRFLDPTYAEEVAPLRPPVRPTPLQFRLFEAIGESLPTASLPLPFAVVELSGDAGWRAQLQAAERLARAGAIDGNQLLGAYSEQRRAASGGIWDRVDALQELDAALTTRDDASVSEKLEAVWPQMRSAGLLVPFSNLFASRLQDRELTENAASLAGFAALLSDAYEPAGQMLETSDKEHLRFLAAIARGEAPVTTPRDVPHAAALARAWRQESRAISELADLPSEYRLGEALLKTIELFGTGAEGNIDQLANAIQTLRSFGMEDIARRSALQLAILDMEGARR